MWKHQPSGMVCSCLFIFFPFYLMYISFFPSFLPSFLLFRDNISEDMLAKIRFQWWRDNVEGASKGVRIGHPTVDSLCDAFEKFPISKTWLLRMINSRVRHFPFV